MNDKGQLEMLLELRDLEKAIKGKRGKERKAVEGRIKELSSKIDSRVLKLYRHLAVPFGEFRDRTCSACGMIYPKTHIHCRPSAGEIRLCEGCGRILIFAKEGENASGS